MIIIASIAFSFLATSYDAFCRYYFKARVENGQGKNRSYLEMRVEEGNFLHGELQDKGKPSLLFGFIIKKGQFKLGKLHGQGKQTLSDGEVEKGKLEKGVLIEPQN